MDGGPPTDNAKINFILAAYSRKQPRGTDQSKQKIRNKHKSPLKSFPTTVAA